MGNMNPIQIVDLFAGPGGLGEGFSSLRDQHNSSVFQIVLSIEKDEIARRTLRLRAFSRKVLKNGVYPPEYIEYISDPNVHTHESLMKKFSDEWKAADQEAIVGTLGQDNAELIQYARERLALDSGPVVVIGGPPCQAYSLAGRSRRTHDPSLLTDEKQTLYKAYLDFLEELKPDAFIMENVKGMLSARLNDSHVFDLITGDMRALGYEVFSLVTDNPRSSKDYVVRTENYGIPQARHRVILFGVNKKYTDHSRITTLAQAQKESTVFDAISQLPKLRSSFSGRSHSQTNDWGRYVRSAAERILGTEEGLELATLLRKLMAQAKLPQRTRAETLHGLKQPDNPLQEWYRRHLSGYTVIPNHETRSHMPLDLDRYLFSSVYAKHRKQSPKLWDFPNYLIPNHRNAQAAKTSKNKDKIKFADRFRVQLYGRPSTTITSHIAKDGHYYIHPDPSQCRSLTVREAARLQTFPDDYFFEGNRTQQYQQVGNAVPPLLARQIAAVVAELFDREYEI